MAVSTWVTLSHNPRSIFYYSYLINLIHATREEPPANAYLDYIIYTLLVLLRTLLLRLTSAETACTSTTVAHPMGYDVWSNMLLLVFEAPAPPFIETYMWHVRLGRVTVAPDRCIFKCGIRYP